MREAFAGLGIEGRIGVCTGEVVTGTAERLATGDALNVAARLQGAAAPGEVLIAEATRLLAGDAVDVEAVEALALKGKSEPVAAFRLLGARTAGERRQDRVFVGRERELELLSDAWGQVVAGQRCELVTVVGEPGIGKSRLAAEALALIGARVVRGRCLSYGAGITYWPVVEVVKQLGVLPSDPAAAAAIRSLLRESEAGTSAQEIGWAFRKLLEEQAPVVVVFDDIQWGEQTFLDLVERLVLLSSGAPILVVCLARPELHETRPSWPLTLRLEPLSGEEAANLIGAGVAAELGTRIAAAAGGNPLFIGEMLAMAADAGDEVVVPQSLQALLAARLDRLDAAERRVLERGAVEGEVFHGGAVQALTPEETRLTTRLAALTRRELIRTDTPQFVGEDGYRFRHLLIRDSAYNALWKATRADLHERMLFEGGSVDELEQLARRAIPMLEQAENHAGLVHAWRALGHVANTRCRYEDWAHVAEQVHRHTRLAGRGNLPSGLWLALTFGPRPADEALRTLDERFPEDLTPRSSLFRAWLLTMLARFDEAEQIAQLGRELGDDQDALAQALWRQVQALVDASRGQHTRAGHLAREAVAFSERSDGLNWQGDALSDLAEVLHAAGRGDEAAATLTRALERYERKHNLAQAAQTRDRLAELQDAAPR